MKVIVFLSRVIVAITFIFSGFVKLVDPLGSTYKFEEYFRADVLNLEFLIPYALPFSILLIISEITFGVMLLVGYFPKLTTRSLLIISAIFLFLTWYTAYYNKVTDCGCFGDAIKLSSWNTFYKNVILILLVLLLAFKSKLIKPLFGLSFAKWTTFLSVISFLYLTYYVLTHLPIIDFRPFAIGKSIPEGMQYVGDKTPSIQDFYLEDTEGNEKTKAVLAKNKIMLVVAYNLSKSEKEGFSSIKKLTDKALKEGYTVYALSSSMQEDFEEIKKEYELQFDLLFADETLLKTIVRANPGIVILNKGIVIGKWSYNDAEKVKL